ncbi:calcium/proton exchanger [Marasmius fiardii PR-910]|nr:calcium/proton exchanger [Marasmius fiardii PR-910]
MVHRTGTGVSFETGKAKEESTFTSVAPTARPHAAKPPRFLALFTPQKPLIGPEPTYSQSLIALVRYTPLNICLLFIPVSWALHFTHQNDTIVFVFSCLGIIPLAALLGFATEQIALRTSSTVGGLLNATLGNVVEMIIAGIALKRCELELVQSSLLGGLLSNLLLVLGMAFLVGGYRFHQQEFQPMVAQLNSSLMTAAVIALIIPAAFHEYLGDRLPQGEEFPVLLQLSRGSAIILMFIYFAYLFFQFYSHNHLFLDTVQSSPRSSFSSVEDTLRPGGDHDVETTSSISSNSELEYARLNIPVAIMVLIATTALAYETAECLVDSLRGLTEANPSVSKEWLTLIVIPVISNAAEHTTAVVVAHKGKFDLAMSVAVGSCIQIALFVIPLLVLVAWGMGKPLTLLFDEVETLVLFLSVILVKFSIEDGKSHWMSGIVLVSVYVLIAMSFWSFPVAVRMIQGQPLSCT